MTRTVLSVVCVSFIVLCISEFPCVRDIADFGNQNLACQIFLNFPEIKKLSSDQQETLRKAKTERLRVMAAKTGDLDDDELKSMDRAALMDIVVKGMLAKKETDRGQLPGGQLRERTQQGKWNYS